MHEIATWTLLVVVNVVLWAHVAYGLWAGRIKIFRWAIRQEAPRDYWFSISLFVALALFASALTACLALGIKLPKLPRLPF